MARQDGMPRPELIFLHSGSADGCNNAQHVPPVSSDLKKRVKAVTGCTSGSSTAANAIEDELSQFCGGDAIAALRITLRRISGSWDRSPLCRGVIRLRSLQS